MVEHAASAHSHGWYLLSSTGSDVDNLLKIYGSFFSKMSCAFFVQGLVWVCGNIGLQIKQFFRQ
jgi:hypothetical protein